MNPEKVRKMSAEMLNCGANRIWFDPLQADKIKAVMTKEDLRALVKEGAVRKKRMNFHSRGKARILKAKKSKGRRKKTGSRKGTKKARVEPKKRWAARARAMRRELKRLQKEKPKAVEKIGYRKLYMLIKGNFFRGKKYLAAYVEGKKTKE